MSLKARPEGQTEQSEKWQEEQTPSKPLTEKKIQLSGLKHAQPHCLAHQYERKNNSEKSLNKTQCLLRYDQ